MHTFCPSPFKPCQTPYKRHKVTHQSLSSVAQASKQGVKDVSDGGVIIVGAGIAGLAIASALQKISIPAVVLERDAGPRLEGSAIGLWPNAFKALDALDVAQPLRDSFPLLQRVELCNPEGDVLRNFHLDECKGAPHEFRGVLRSSLLKTLENSLAKDTVQYSSPISKVEETDAGAQVTLEGGEKVTGRIVLGADGARSEVARYLGLADPKYAGYSAYRGVAELKGPLPVPKDTVRQLLGRGVRAGMYPLSENSIYWFIAMTCPVNDVPPPAKYKEDALKLVKGWKYGMEEAVQNTPAEALTRNRIGDRWLLPTKPFGKGSISVAGDAAHPMTPNLGQGGCTALEDAVVLAQVLREATKGGTLTGLTKTQISSALREYEQKRALRVTKITVRSNLMGQILSKLFLCSFQYILGVLKIELTTT